VSATPRAGAADDPTAPLARVEVRGATLVCRAELADTLRAWIEAHGSLYGHAAAHPERRELRGRAVSWAVPLPGGDGVVRHSWHGGLLAPLTRDLFLPPTRAPHEQQLSARLRAAGIRTPEVLAYALYPAPLGLRRADVVTRLVPGGEDLAALLSSLPVSREPRSAWVRATGGLLHALARAGVRHPDLNLKNVLLTPAAEARAARAHGARPAGARDPDAALDAWVLDLDVARMSPSPSAGRVHAIGAANLERLERSFERWRTKRGLSVSEVELACLRVYARHGADAQVDVIWRPGHNLGPT
jgi:3-deoxy-D-manno-octulosonic acid kinase